VQYERRKAEPGAMSFAKSGTLTPEEARAETRLLAERVIDATRVKTQLNMNHFNKMCHFKNFRSDSGGNFFGMTPLCSCFN
jgi:hypothetical protein